MKCSSAFAVKFNGSLSQQSNMLITKAIFAMLVLNLQGCSCILLETILKIREFNKFETIFIFGDKSSESPRTDVPAIYFSEWTSLEIKETFNTNVLAIAFVEDLVTLDTFLSYFSNICAPKILLVSSKLPKRSIFERFHQRVLPNAVLLQKKAFHSFCCVNGNTPLEIFEIPQSQIFRNHRWMQNYKEHNVTWNNSYVSVKRTCELGSACKLVRVFGQLYNGLEQIFLSNESSTPVFHQNPYKNVSSYEISTFIELIGVVVVSPTDFSNNEMMEFFYLPFDKLTWLSYISTLFYFAFILSIVSFLDEGTLHFSSHLFDSLEILMARGIDVRKTRILQRPIILSMSIFGFMMVTLYGTFLGSFVIASVGNRQFEIICEPKRFKIFNTFQPQESHKVKWKIIETHAYVLYQFLMDSKYGYCIYSHIWLNFDSFQRELDKKHFQLQYKTPQNQWVKNFVQRVYADSFRICNECVLIWIPYKMGER